jgi:hypothetical protein
MRYLGQTSENGYRARLPAALRTQIKILDLASRPGLPAQEDQARTHAGLVREAADGDAPPELSPAISGVQLFEHRLERDAVQRILRVHAWPRSLWRWRTRRYIALGYIALGYAARGLFSGMAIVALFGHAASLARVRPREVTALPIE